ncbi:hypothetical protein PIB30_104250 [Stylosanthes scabra]|uniref:Uncharacterized protein n=1 Tax=Stylosanthes scabra TaxID=79078 RepID=A0ABU6YZQ3_9FABA|nr:hypothetical protein [Stylosanthes scabra]
MLKEQPQQSLIIIKGLTFVHNVATTSRRLLHFLSLALMLPSMFPSPESGKDRNNKSGSEGLKRNPHSPNTTPYYATHITGSSLTGWSQLSLLHYGGVGLRNGGAPVSRLIEVEEKEEAVIEHYIEGVDIRNFSKQTTTSMSVNPLLHAEDEQKPVAGAAFITGGSKTMSNHDVNNDAIAEE